MPYWSHIAFLVYSIPFLGKFAIPAPWMLIFPEIKWLSNNKFVDVPKVRGLCGSWLKNDFRDM